jgi:hypothetical protein
VFVDRVGAFFAIRNERERRASEYKTQQRQSTPEDKALFEAAPSIIKQGERVSLTLDKVRDALRARSLPIKKDARRLSQVTLLNTKGNNQLRVSGIFSSSATSN